LALTRFANALCPPPPGEFERLRKTGRLSALQQRAAAYRNHRISAQLSTKFLRAYAGMSEETTPVPMAPLPAWKGLPTSGTNKVLFFLIDFPDYPHSTAPETVTEKLFGAGNPSEYPYESLRAYYLRSSYSNLVLTGNVLGWYRMLHNRAWYTNNYGDGESAIAAMVKEVAGYYDASHDYSQYDNDGDGNIDCFVVIWAGPHDDWADFWWSYHWSLSSTNVQFDGVRFLDFSWEWELYNPTDTFSPLITIHEIGHALGLPDYYDYDYSVGPPGGLGGLDMMDNNKGDHNAFSKFMLGWLTPVVVTARVESLPLLASAQFPSAVAIMPAYDGSTPYMEWFLVQNRHRTLNDTPNPSDGLLIWHVDARPDQSRQDFRFDNSYTEHKLLRLMEADGLEEIEAGKKANSGDYYKAGQQFSDSTFPRSTAYPDRSTQLSVSNISAVGIAMTATFDIRPFSIPVTNDFENDFEIWFDGPQSDFFWSWTNGPAPPPQTGPRAAASGTGYVFVSAAFPNYPYQRACLQTAFDFSQAVSPALAFSYHMYGAMMGTLAVDVYDGIWHSNVWSKSGQQQTSAASPWANAIVSLASYAGRSPVSIRFRAVTGIGERSDMAIDNVRVYETAVITNTLDVFSEFGAAYPPVGRHAYPRGSYVSCMVTSSPLLLADLQREITAVCTGWTGNGSVPASGPSTNTGTFQLMQNSTVTWHWVVSKLALSNQTIAVTTQEMARDAILAADGYQIIAPGHVTFRVGTSGVVRLAPGFSAQSGAVFRTQHHQ